MKRTMLIISFVLSGLLLLSCGEKEPSNGKQEDYTQLVSKVNSNVGSLQSLVASVQSGDPVTAIKDLDNSEGKSLVLLSGKTVSFKTNNLGGEPSVGVRNDSDGNCCWVVNGTILSNEGKSLMVASSVPSFKYEGDAWSYSVDQRKTWNDAGKAKSSNQFISNISVQAETIVLKFGDGSSLVVPVYTDSGVSSIQSISFKPESEDGKSYITPSGTMYIAEIAYEVSPASALEKVAASTGVSYLMKAVFHDAESTKADEDETKTIKVTSTRVEGSTLIVRADFSGMGEDFNNGKKEASATLSITDGLKTVVGPAVPVLVHVDKPSGTSFNESAVVLSLGVVSDVHINTGTSMPSNKFTNALAQLKAKASESDKDGMDALLVAGDLIDNPNNSYLNEFKSRYEAACDPTKVPMIYTIGNHDVPSYRWSASMVNDAAYMRNGLGSNYFLVDKDNDARTKMECRHCVVGGYNILCVTPNGTQPIVYDANALNWLESKLKEITEAEPDKYVILLTHPMIADTIYGSLLGEASGEWASSLSHYWATSALTSILDKYPQVVVFGGHLHFPLNDPRSAWQGGFTVLGCASVRYMAIESGGYVDMASATTMKDKDEFSQGNLIQFDESGNMRVLRMDFYHSDVIDEPLLMSHPSGKETTHLQAYSHKVRSVRNGIPSTPTADVVTDGATTITFHADDDEFVHDYTVTVTKGASTICNKKFLTDFYKHPKISQMASSITLSLGELAVGTYSLKIVARDSWGATSTLEKNFTIAQGGSFWTDDNAGSRKVSAGDGSVSDDWLSYSSGTLSWTANTTGSARKKSISLPDGSSCTVTQVSVDDFKGKYDFVSKVFAMSGAVHSANDPGTIAVTIGAPLSGATLKDEKGVSHTNNIGITGLYGSSVLDGCVEIDYEGMSAKVGLFLDTRDGIGQKVSDGYVTYAPGLVTVTSTSWGKPWVFGETELGDPDYVWMWFEVANDLKSFGYANRTSANVVFQTVGQYSSSTMNSIVGFGVIKSASNAFNHSTVTDVDNGYSNFFQCNASGANKEYFQKK